MSNISYIDVPIETDPDVLATDAIEWLTANVPGFVPREGHLEVAIMEVVARMVAVNRDVASAVPTSIFRYFGQSFIGIPPVDAAPATVRSTWTVINTNGYTIPAGTNVAFQLASDRQTYFQVVDPVTIAPGQTSTASGEVLLQALNPGAAANGIPAGPVSLVDALAYVSQVVSIEETTGGVDAEAESEYLDRLRSELRIMSPRPTLPDDFAVLARRIAGVDRSIAIDGYDPSTGTYNNARTVAVALADAQGNAVSATVRETVRAYLEAQREVNFLVNIIDPTITRIEVTATVKALSGYDKGDVQAACVDRIREYLSPQSWDWRAIVRVNELVSLLDRIEGVDYVEVISTPASNIILQGVAALVDTGTVSIAVT